MAMLGIRLRAFAAVLNLDRPHLYFQDHILPNSAGLAFDPAHADERAALVRATQALGSAPGLRWLLGSHGIWLAAAAIGFAVVVRRDLRAQRVSPALVLCAVPLAYDLSYLVPAATLDYRYLFPATLLLQCTALFALCSRLLASTSMSRAG